MKIAKWLLISSLAVLFSCSKDSDSSSSQGPISDTNLAELTFNGNNYVIKDAKMIDSYHVLTLNHSQCTFLFADKDITVNIGGPGAAFTYQIPFSSRFNIRLTLHSYGETFQNGDYLFENSEIPLNSYFDQCSIAMDTNNDGNSDSYLQAVSGKITSSGTAPNHTLHFNVMLSNGQPLDFIYSGGFEYFNNRD